MIINCNSFGRLKNWSSGKDLPMLCFWFSFFISTKQSGIEQNQLYSLVLIYAMPEIANLIYFLPLLQSGTSFANPLLSL